MPQHSGILHRPFQLILAPGSYRQRSRSCCGNAKFGGKLKMTIATLRNLLQDESGQDLIEYALVAALIALGAVVAMRGLATGLSSAFSSIASNLTAAA
jgi:pilus assembly protein Flp/PilA